MFCWGVWSLLDFIEHQLTIAKIKFYVQWQSWLIKLESLRCYWNVGRLWIIVLYTQTSSALLDNLTIGKSFPACSLSIHHQSTKLTFLARAPSSVPGEYDPPAAYHYFRWTAEVWGVAYLAHVWWNWLTPFRSVSWLNPMRSDHWGTALKDNLNTSKRSNRSGLMDEAIKASLVGMDRKMSSEVVR